MQCGLYNTIVQVILAHLLLTCAEKIIPIDTFRAAIIDLLTVETSIHINNLDEESLLCLIFRF